MALFQCGVGCHSRRRDSSGGGAGRTSGVHDHRHYGDFCYHYNEFDLDDDNNHSSSHDDHDGTYNYNPNSCDNINHCHHRDGPPAESKAKTLEKAPLEEAAAAAGDEASARLSRGDQSLPCRR